MSLVNFVFSGQDDNHMKVWGWWLQVGGSARQQTALGNRNQRKSHHLPTRPCIHAVWCLGINFNNPLAVLIVIEYLGN